VALCLEFLAGKRRPLPKLEHVRSHGAHQEGRK
jgi:hypothetical protein